MAYKPVLQIMKTLGIQKQVIQKLDTNDTRWGFFWDVRKLFRDFLKKLGVPFYDPCCPKTSVTGIFPTEVNMAAQDDIAAGEGGAISVANYFTTINSDAGGDAFTLADGTRYGQQKRIRLVADGGGDAVVTPANLADGTTITLDDAGDDVILAWDGDNWNVIVNIGATVA